MSRRSAHIRTDSRTGKVVRVREHDVRSPSVVSGAHIEDARVARLRDQAAAAFLDLDAAAEPSPPEGPHGSGDPIPLDSELPVFVYGSLRPGFWNYNRVFRGRTRAEEPARLPGATMWDGAFPYVAETEPGGEIVGTIIDVDSGQWDGVRRSLDRLEGFDPDRPDSSHYLRHARMVRLGDGSSRMAWVYFAAPLVAQRLVSRGQPVIESGDWAADGGGRGARP